MALHPLKFNRRLPGRIVTGAVIALTLILATSCHTMIPLAENDIGVAPTLTPPIKQVQPGIGTSIGYKAPDFKLVDLNGNTVQLSDFRGRPILLNFWTYCDICKEELPYIQAVYENRASLLPDLVVLAVNVSQRPDQVQEFVSYYGFTFEFLIDTWATVASDYYIHAIPTSFFIDR
ncbi:MAG TPA: TlpA disulfide reductase family protein, partial [Dehalococcoidales bacterium]|nr:TlpA disulfide reductase family protein [Dehalococcoidales bacterium]